MHSSVFPQAHRLYIMMMITDIKSPETERVLVVELCDNTNMHIAHFLSFLMFYDAYYFLLDGTYDHVFGVSLYWFVFTFY